MPLWTERADLWPHFWKESMLLLAIKSDYACLNLLQVFILTHEMNNKILFIIRKLQSSENAVTDRLAAKAINVKQLTWSIHVVLASSFLIILSWWINLSLHGPSPFICVVGLTLGSMSTLTRRTTSVSSSLSLSIDVVSLGTSILDVSVFCWKQISLTKFLL